MFSHITIGVDDVERAARFYDAFLAPLGIKRFFEKGSTLGWSREGETGHLYISPPFNGEPASPGNGWMCAFYAPTREAVVQAYEAGLAHGGTDEGPPGPRPHYSPHYYGAYVRDPEGNKLHVVLRVT